MSVCLSVHGQDVPGWSCCRCHREEGTTLKPASNPNRKIPTGAAAAGLDGRQHLMEAALLMLMGEKTLQTAPGEKIGLGFSMGRQPAPIPFICSGECLMPQGVAAPPHPEVLQHPWVPFLRLGFFGGNLAAPEHLVAANICRRLGRSWMSSTGSTHGVWGYFWEGQEAQHRFVFYFHRFSWEGIVQRGPFPSIAPSQQDQPPFLGL